MTKLTPMERRIAEHMLTPLTVDEIAKVMKYPKVNALRTAAWRMFRRMGLSGGRVEYMAREIERLKAGRESN